MWKQFLIKTRGENEIILEFLKSCCILSQKKKKCSYYISDVIMSLQLEILTECYCAKTHTEKFPWSLLLLLLYILKIFIFIFIFLKQSFKQRKKILEVSTGETTYYFLGHQSNWFQLDIGKNKSSWGKLGIRAGCPGLLCNLHPWDFQDTAGQNTEHLGLISELTLLWAGSGARDIPRCLLTQMFYVQLSSRWWFCFVVKYFFNMWNGVFLSY